MTYFYFFIQCILFPQMLFSLLKLCIEINARHIEVHYAFQYDKPRPVWNLQIKNSLFTMTMHSVLAKFKVA